MIPVLFAPDTSNFTTNGLGALADCTSCKVTEKRNGEYILTMQYPLDGIHFSDIKHSSIIWAKPSDGGNNQAFRVYKIKKPMNGIVTIEAEHISYQQSKIPVMPFTANSVSAALQGLKTNAAEDCPFFFYTDKQTIATYTQDQPASMRSRLGGVEGSILDVYGGEYEFDNYDVHLWASRGSDKGVALRYGKNITDISQEENIQNVITGICPFYANEDTLVVLPEKVIESEYTALYPYPRTEVVDFSSEWTEEAPTVEQLRARAQQYINDNNIGIPKISIDVSFIALWQTEEYKDIAPLERVNLCDTVTIIFEKLGIEAKAKVIATEYDVLHERYNKISVGDAKSSLANTIVEIDATTNQKIEVVKSYTDKAIVHATELITGGLGGYVYLKPNASGYPEEILIMDSPDIDTAVNIWRWNKNGLGFSSNGYGGPYGTAITSDGQIVADYITAGVLRGDLLQAGTVAASALTIDAQEELGARQNVLAYDLMDNENRWTLHQEGSGAASYSIGTASVRGKDYDAIFLDGTRMQSGDSAYVSFESNIYGNPNFFFTYGYYFTSDADFPDAFTFVDLRTPTAGADHIARLTYFMPGEHVTAWEPFEEHDFEFVKIAKAYPQYGPKFFTLHFVPGHSVTVYLLQIYVEGTAYKKALLNVTTGGIDSVVQNGNVISSINQSAESVNINANKINLTGDLSLRGDFTSYNPSDNSKYCHLDSGNISFYANGSNVFTISSQAILGQYAGIFFGDVQDPSAMADYTYIEQNLISSPTVYCKGDGSFENQNGYTLKADNYSLFSGVTADYLYVTGTMSGASVRTSFHGGVQFYSNVFDSNGGTQFVSDRRKKRNIVDLAISKARSFIMALKPVKFKFTKDISESNRYHHGFIAQDVKEAMSEDWGLYCEDKDNDTIGLRYHELFADMVALLQDHEKRIKELETELKRSKT